MDDQRETWKSGGGNQRITGVSTPCWCEKAPEAVMVGHVRRRKPMESRDETENAWGFIHILDIRKVRQ